MSSRPFFAPRAALALALALARASAQYSCPLVGPPIPPPFLGVGLESSGALSTGTPTRLVITPSSWSEIPVVVPPGSRWGMPIGYIMTHCVTALNYSAASSGSTGGRPASLLLRSVAPYPGVPGYFDGECSFFSYDPIRAPSPTACPPARRARPAPGTRRSPP